MLRLYQKRDLNAILACVQRGVNPLYHLPTGGGKTVVFSEVIRVLSAMGKNACVFVHRKELLDQASRALHRLGIPHGTIAPGHYPTSEKVHVASIDTVSARLDSLRPFLATLEFAVMDEGHHAVASKWQRTIAAFSGAVILGVTATPFRTDGKGLGGVFSEVVSGPGVQDLIDMGFLCAPEIYGPPVNLDLSKVRKRGGDYAAGELSRVVDQPEVIAMAVKAYARYCPGTPVVAFCAGVDHASHVADQFRAAGWNAANVDGAMGLRERERAIYGLEDGSVQVLTSCDIVSEGTDIPVIGGAILLRPTQSTALFLQQVGRSLRPYSGKDSSILIDLAGNLQRHGMPQAERQWTLEGGIKGQERDVTATRRCRSCYHIHEKADSCPKCGYTYQTRPKHPTGLPFDTLQRLPGIRGHTALEISEMPFQRLLNVAKTEADLRHVAKIRGYQPGWVAHIMKDRKQRAFSGYRRSRR